jgi:outer membrane immunogenic protein
VVGNMLPYVTGGLAFGHVTNSYYDPTKPIDTSWSNGRTGWAAGAGVEDALARNVTMKLEFLYVDLGAQTAEDAAISALYPDTTITTKTSFSTLRVGFNWKLN